jgi:predicted AAA+ superfamily ATPase
MPKIKDLLRDLNPWWKEEFGIEYKQRDIYNQIKYGKINLKGMLAFMKLFNVKMGYVISRDKEETRKNNGTVISVVPAFTFFLSHDWLEE